MASRCQRCHQAQAVGSCSLHDGAEKLAIFILPQTCLRFFGFATTLTAVVVTKAATTTTITWRYQYVFVRLDRFHIQGWPNGVDISGITEYKARSLVGESVSLYSWACLLMPALYNARDPTLWQVPSTFSHEPYKLRTLTLGSSSAAETKVSAKKEADLENARKMIKRRRIGGKK